MLQLHLHVSRTRASQIKNRENPLGQPEETLPLPVGRCVMLLVYSAPW